VVSLFVCLFDQVPSG